MIVPTGAAVTVNVTVRSDVIPKVFWTFTSLLGDYSGLLNTSDTTLNQASRVLVLDEEHYQVWKVFSNK